MFTTAFWKALWSSAQQKDGLKRRIKSLRHDNKMKDEEIRWLREQVDGYRDAFQSLQEEYRARGALAATQISSLSHEPEVFR